MGRNERKTPWVIDITFDRKKIILQETWAAIVQGITSRFEENFEIRELIGFG